MSTSPITTTATLTAWRTAIDIVNAAELRWSGRYLDSLNGARADIADVGLTAIYEDSAQA